MNNTVNSLHHFILNGTNISKAFKKNAKPVLENISFTAESGQCIGILGANGCGKSTLLSILAGAQHADCGTLTLNGKSLFDSKTPSRKEIGYVPQENPLIEELTAYDNLRLWYCDSRLKLKAELENGILAMLGIPDFLHVRVNQMSGGMKKRLNIGCAVAQDPPVLLLDEPGAALDLICKERIGVYLRNRKAQGKIILIATHEEQEIDLCDQIYILKNSQLQPADYDGNIHHLVSRL